MKHVVDAHGLLWFLTGNARIVQNAILPAGGQFDDSPIGFVRRLARSREQTVWRRRCQRIESGKGATMRIAGIILTLLGALLLADQLLAGLARPMIDPGMAPPAGAPPSRLAGPAVLLVAGLLLLRKPAPPRDK